jgi:hypothetical protein
MKVKIKDTGIKIASTIIGIKDTRCQGPLTLTLTLTLTIYHRNKGKNRRSPP